MLQPHLKGDLSPHTLLYLDHYQRTAATSRPSSASPVRHRPRRRPQTAAAAAVTSEKKCYSRMKHLRQEFATLTREHQRLNTSRSNPRELEIINRRMEIILEELDQLQRQLRQTTNRRSTSIETPLETLRKTRLLQVILKDASQKEQHQGRSHRRTRPPTSSSVDG